MTKRKKILLIVLIPVLLIIASFASYSYIYAAKIYPNTTIADIDIGGLSRDEATKLLSYQIDLVKNQEIELLYQNKILTITPDELDLSYDLPKSLDRAYDLGRSDLWYNKIIQRSKSLWFSNKYQVAFKINKTKLDQTINNLSREIDIPVKNASLEVKNWQVIATKAQTGYELDQSQLKNTFVSAIGNLKGSRSIYLPINVIVPQLTDTDIYQAQNDLQKLVKDDFVLKTPEEKIILTRQDMLNWIELIAQPIELDSPVFDSEAQTRGADKSKYQLKIVFNEQKISAHIKNLASKIDREAVDAKLTTQDGNIKIFTISQQGLKLDQDATLKSIVASLTLSGYVAGVTSDQSDQKLDFNTIILPITLFKPNVTENNILDLGIKELVATASTSYKGSPENRRSNIKTGAEMFNGVVIKPNEEFSFLKYLGSVSEERGFKKELVIKQDSTEPEVGGGLCQVSTTMFRVALNAGLKITERTNHKYRVSYYEPPVGLDATIYEPSPDLKFVNDTPGHILVQTKIKDDNNITFEFYGTKDGRVVSISNSELYSYVNPPETRYVDDPNMNEGETKYLEKAHTGVKAKVNYQVKRDDKIINEQTFYSTYKAWGAVIKRGTKKVEQPAPTSTPEPTPAPTPEPTPAPTPTPEPAPTPTPPAEPAPKI